MAIFHELTPGATFKLNPTARTMWVMFGGYKNAGERVQVDAIRTDTEIGEKLLQWIASGERLHQEIIDLPELTQADIEAVGKYAAY